MAGKNVKIAGARRQGCRAAALILALGCGASNPEDGGAEEPAPQAQEESHRRMVALLADIEARETHDNLYLGEAALLRSHAFEAGLPADASPRERVQARMMIALEELRLGRSATAVELLEGAKDQAAKLPEPERGMVWSNASYYAGVASLRLAEDENCVAHHEGSSCIVPFAEAAEHRVETGSRKAMGHFRDVLEASEPGSEAYVTSRWLYNLAAMTLGEYPDGVPAEYRVDPAVIEGPSDFPRFQNVAPNLGVHTENLCGGAAIDDFDGDGYLDVVTTTWDFAGPMTFLAGTGGAFRDATEEMGLAGIHGGLNLNHADYDGDGRLDLLVLRGSWMGPMGKHPNSLLRNTGERFYDVSHLVGLAEVHYPTHSASWSDYDLDGDLDLYVGNESNPRFPCPSQLFENDGAGRFDDVAQSAGVTNDRYAKGVAFGDVDGDRYPDLYVSNLGERNRLYVNRGDGTFVDRAPALGLDTPIESFATWFWDFDNDGHLDLFVGSYPQGLPATTPYKRLFPIAASYLGVPFETELDAVYRNDGAGGFADVGRELGLVRATQPMGANVGDLDNDGFEDFYLGTGYPFFDGLMPNLMYRNRGGERFEDVTMAGGFGNLQKGHGVAFADLDGDGDLDVFEQMGGAYPGDAFMDALYVNPGFGNHWIRVTLEGVESVRCAIGAALRVTVVEDGERRTIHRAVGTGGSFGSNPLSQTIGVGRAERVESLEVHWPRTGRTQRFEDVEVDAAYRIREDTDALERVSIERFELLW